MSNFVLHDSRGRYVVIDPCGWPVFDKELCRRTTRLTREEAEVYANNCEKNGVPGLVVEEI